MYFYYFYFTAISIKVPSDSIPILKATAIYTPIQVEAGEVDAEMWMGVMAGGLR